MSPTGRAGQLFYLVLDGLGDVPCASLGGQTPLEAATVPHFDELARGGEVFRLDMRDSEGLVSTSSGQFALFGYDDDDSLPKRGAVEAAGIGLALQTGDVALRANWATLDDRGFIVDRRAGRIREGTEPLAAAIDGLDLGDGITALVRSGTEHRVALVLRGRGLAAGVTDSDPQLTSDSPLEPLSVDPLDDADSAARLTAAKLQLFLSRIRPILTNHPVNQQRRTRGLLPANGLITRRAGRHAALPTMEDHSGLRCLAIAGDSTVIGVMRLLGCETLWRSSFTANVDTDLNGKLAAAERALDSGNDIVLLHIKAMDILSHDRRPDRSVAMLQQLDELLGTLLSERRHGLLIAIGADHSTSSVTGDHSVLPTPALIHGSGAAASGIAAFHERALAEASVTVLQRSAFFHRILAVLAGAPAQP
ncbi:MAG: phosphoglycerate mutase [Deltaproteobacteria bacterium]|nr:MAG: phosphoglycerate mutase [Deltaproteobacteria bacterium]